MGTLYLLTAITATLQVYTGKEGIGEKQLGQKVVKDLTWLPKGEEPPHVLQQLLHQ